MVRTQTWSNVWCLTWHSNTPCLWGQLPNFLQFDTFCLHYQSPMYSSLTICFVISLNHNTICVFYHKLCPLNDDFLLFQGYILLSVFVWAAITKCHHLSDLNNRCLFLHSSEGWKVQDQGIGRVSLFYVPWKKGFVPGLCPWCADGLLSVSSCGLSSVLVHFLTPFSYKDSSHIGLGPTLMTLL